MNRKFGARRAQITKKINSSEDVIKRLSRFELPKEANEYSEKNLLIIICHLNNLKQEINKNLESYEKLKNQCSDDEWMKEKENYDAVLIDVQMINEDLNAALERAKYLQILMQDDIPTQPTDVDETPRNKGVSKINITNLDIKDDISNCEETSPEEVKNNSGKNSDKNPDKNPDEESSMRPKESHEDSQDVQIKSNDGDDESINEVIDVLVDKIDNETCCPEGKLSLNVVVDEVPIIKEEIWTDPNECNGNPCEKFEDDDQTKADTSGSMTNAFINDQDIQRWLKNNSKKKELYYNQEFYKKNDEQRWIKNKCKKKRSLKGKNLNKLQIGFRKRLKKNKKRKRCFNEKRYNYISSEAKWARNHARKKSTRYFLNEKEEKWLKNMKKKKRTKTPTTIVTWMIYDHVDNNNNGLQDDDILVAPGAQTRACSAESKSKQQQQEVHLGVDDNAEDSAGPGVSKSC